MIASGVNASKGHLGSSTGISKGDAVWLRSMRHSAVSKSPMYQRVLQTAKAGLYAKLNALPGSS